MSMYIELTTRCNMTCGHCCGSCGPEGDTFIDYYTDIVPMLVPEEP